MLKEDESCVRRHGWRPAVEEFDGKDTYYIFVKGMNVKGSRMREPKKKKKERER